MAVRTVPTTGSGLAITLTVASIAVPPQLLRKKPRQTPTTNWAGCWTDLRLGDRLDLRPFIGMARGVDSARVPLAVDRGYLPRAPADSTESPSPRTAVSFRQGSGAVATGAAPLLDLVYGEPVVEHLFDQW
jgi:hypothetical protein